MTRRTNDTLWSVAFGLLGAVCMYSAVSSELYALGLFAWVFAWASGSHGSRQDRVLTIRQARGPYR